MPRGESLCFVKIMRFWWKFFDVPGASISSWLKRFHEFEDIKWLAPPHQTINKMPNKKFSFVTFHRQFSSTFRWDFYHFYVTFYFSINLIKNYENHFFFNSSKKKNEMENQQSSADEESNGGRKRWWKFPSGKRWARIYFLCLSLIWFGFF